MNTPVVRNDQVVAEVCEEGEGMQVGRGVGRVGTPMQEQHTGRPFSRAAQDERRVKGNAIGAGELQSMQCPPLVAVLWMCCWVLTLSQTSIKPRWLEKVLLTDPTETHPHILHQGCLYPVLAILYAEPLCASCHVKGKEFDYPVQGP